MRASSSLSLITIALAVAAMACSTPKSGPSSFSANPLTPGSGEVVKTDNTLILVDASGSTEQVFNSEKNLLEAFVKGMPAGDHAASIVAFGGSTRQRAPLSGFSRASLASQASQVSYIGSYTPIQGVFEEAADRLDDTRGHLAVVLLSDGVANAPYGPGDPAGAVDAARDLIRKHNGTTCIHTIQVGDDPAGAALLSELAGLTPCGSTANWANVSSASGLESFQRQVFLGRGTAPVAAPAPSDRDGDGVLDNADRCPNTPTGASVDARGCWVLTDINFALDSAQIDGRYAEEIDEVVSVLRANPGLKVSVDGFTDSSGTEEYNQGLSERRARSVRDRLIAGGASSDQLSARGFGESQPIAPNDTPENRAENRRTELTVR